MMGKQMKKALKFIALYTGVAGLIAFIITLVSSSLNRFFDYFIISFIFTFFISFSSHILFKLVEKYNRSALKSWKNSVLLGILGIFIGTESAVITVRYTLHIVVFNSLTGHLVLLTMTLIIGLIITLSITYHHELKYKIEKKEREIEHLKRLQAESQYAILQSKVNPHFLFNTLSTMAGMVYKNPEKVEQMILNLSSVYRKILNTNYTMISIKDEMEVVEKYLEIEKMRMGERLNYNIDVEEDVLYCMIPFMVIEMIVENAVIHGISPKREGGNIDIKIRKDGAKVIIVVNDNGIGIKEGTKEGFALTNIRTRLKTMVKDSKFVIDSDDRGVSVKMEFMCEN